MMAERVGQPIVDYVIPSGYPAGGVFPVGRHDEDQARQSSISSSDAARSTRWCGRSICARWKWARPYAACSAAAACCSTTRPRADPRVAAIAKRAMKPGELIERGIGGFQFRGEAIKLAQHPDHVPIGLLRKTALKRAVEPARSLPSTISTSCRAAPWISSWSSANRGWWKSSRSRKAGRPLHQHDGDACLGG